MIIGIDPGHGGANIGTHHYGVEEEHYVLETALLLRQTLTGMGMGVELSRNGSQTISFEDRARALALANFILVLHVNASTMPEAKDLRTYVADDNPIAMRAAIEIERTAPAFIAPQKPTTVRATTQPDTVRCYNTMVQHLPKPTVLVEMFFASHELSARWAQTPYGRASLVTCLAAGAVNAWYHTEVNRPYDNDEDKGAKPNASTNPSGIPSRSA